MFFPSLRRSPIFNQKLHDYCLKSTYDSINKKVAKIDQERKTRTNFNYDLLLKNVFLNPDPNNIFTPLLVFLSISFLYCFNNSKKSICFSYNSI
jgi:hypothetical protein